MGIWNRGFHFFGVPSRTSKSYWEPCDEMKWNPNLNSVHWCLVNGLVHWSRKSKKLFASNIRHRSNEHTFSNRMKTTYLIPFFPGLTVITHV
jgi:hypothetical protein